MSNHSFPLVITGKISDRVCITKKEFLHHWLLEDIPGQFVASHESLWNVHEVALGTTSAYEVNYNIIVDSEKGPEVLQHKNTVATQFHIDKNYECTTKIMKNFVDFHIMKIQEKGKIHLMIEEAENLMKTLMYTKGPHTSRTSRSQFGRKRSKMDQNEVMEHKANATNSLRKEGIRPATSKSKYSSRPGRALTTRASSRQIGDRIMTASHRSRVGNRRVRLFTSEKKPQSERQQRGMFYRTGIDQKELRLKTN
mmetsp:Transcript_32700/g.28966  ORF Transcript_32700/g.28966 Transcript_32700/m.28966 type:complete len:253 (+) Transcript_32700:630-1388(+)